MYGLVTGTTNLALGNIQDDDWVPPMALEQEEVLLALDDKQEGSPACDFEDLNAGVDAVEHPPPPPVATPSVRSFVFCKIWPVRFLRESHKERLALEIANCSLDVHFIETLRTSSLEQFASKVQLSRLAKKTRG